MIIKRRRRCGKCLAGLKSWPAPSASAASSSCNGGAPRPVAAPVSKDETEAVTYANSVSVTPLATKRGANGAIAWKFTRASAAWAVIS